MTAQSLTVAEKVLLLSHNLRRRNLVFPKQARFFLHFKPFENWVSWDEIQGRCRKTDSTCFNHLKSGVDLGLLEQDKPAGTEKHTVSKKHLFKPSYGLSKILDDGTPASEAHQNFFREIEKLGFASLTSLENALMIGLSPYRIGQTELCVKLKLTSGSISPICDRLEKAEFIHSETLPTPSGGRPLRRYWPRPKLLNLINS